MQSSCFLFVPPSLSNCSLNYFDVVVVLIAVVTVVIDDVSAVLVKDSWMSCLILDRDKSILFISTVSYIYMNDNARRGKKKEG